MATLALRDGWLVLEPPRLMGVLNATPDSFSDGGRFFAPGAALRHALQMVTEGAHIIDVGGESTRPGAARVAAEIQISRILPVLRAIRERSPVPLSVDTSLAEVAAKALDAGADMVNDVSAGRDDPKMLSLVADRGVPIVLMHMRGEPKTMQDDVRYEDVVSEVSDFLARRAEAAERAGVARDRVVLDPGIGFGKTVDDNVSLLRHLDRLRALGYPILLGLSRKSFLGALTGRSVDERLPATLAALAAGTLAGAAILRVHDVAAARDAVQVAHALRGTSPWEARP